MHMADALLAPTVAATMYVASGVAAGTSIVNLRKEEAKYSEPLKVKLPAMAVMSALVFAGQMINYTIPGTGSSGHLCGGMLLSSILGPFAGFLSMIVILTIQCLFFADMMMRRTVEQMEKLQEVAEKQELLMGALSHEMRTPLTSIIGYSDTLRHVKLKDEQKDRALEHINREGKRLEALSGKMLQMLGLYQNHAIQMEMTMAGDLLNHVIDMEKEQAEKKAVHLKMECEAFSMKMDPALMESLLINLIDNALKATDAGGSIWVKAYEKAGKKIFEVSDTGMGIPEEELGKITDAFYMVDKSRSRKEGGSGLGLALCVKVAEIHGGCLKIESRQREGTTVRAIF